MSDFDPRSTPGRPGPSPRAECAADASVRALGPDERFRRLLGSLRGEDPALQLRIQELEQENRRLGDEMVQAQEQALELAERYVVLAQLSAAADRAEGLQAIQEIVINLVGSEEFAVLQGGPAGLETLLTFGLRPEQLQRLLAAPGAVGRAALQGEPYLAGQGAPAPGDEALTAAIPLRVAGRPAGAIAVFRLLGQKLGLSPADHALFELLGEHGAAALRLAPAGGELPPAG